MKTLLKASLLIAVLTTAANAQFSLGVYFSIWSDGNNVYAEAEQQYSPGQNCTMCADAYHTYYQSMALSGSDGSYDTCSNNTQGPATTPQNIACTAQVVYNWEANSNSLVYASSATENDNCNMIGNFMDASYDPGKVTIYHRAYQFTGMSKLNPSYCLWGNYPGGGCPGVSSKAPFSTLGCGPATIMECADVYNNYTGEWDYRAACVGIGPPSEYPASLATCSSKM